MIKIIGESMQQLMSELGKAQVFATETSDELLPPILRHLVELLHHSSHDGGGGDVDEVLHELDGLLLGQVQPELVLHLPHSLVRLEGDVRNACLHHQSKEVENKIGVTTQVQESSIALFPEVLVMLTIHPSHGINHLLGQLHGRRQGLGISAKNVTEVNVNQVAGGGEHQIVQMPVAHSQQVGDDAVTSTRFHPRVHALSRHSIGPSLTGVVLAEKVQDTPLPHWRLFQHVSNAGCFHKLHETRVGRGCKCSIGRQLEIQVLPPEQLVHQADDLENKLVLSQVVPDLEDCWVFTSFFCDKCQS